MKRLSIIFYVVFFFAINAAATTNNKKGGEKNTVYINGTLNGKSFKEAGVAIYVHDQWFRYRGDLDARNYVLDSTAVNDFLEISTNEDITYLQFYQPTSLSKTLRNTWMFVQPGDSIVLDINNGELSVSGNCADRIKCLWEIFNINTKFYRKDNSDEAIRLKDMSDRGLDTTGVTNWEQYYYDQFVQGFEVIDYLYDQKIKVLNRFAEKITKSEYDFIALECDVSRKWSYLEDWTEMPIVSDIHRQAKQRFLNENLERFAVKTTNEEFALRSLLFADVIAKNEVISLYNKKGAYGKNRGAKPAFLEVDQAIQQKYSRRLYDKITTAVFSGVKVLGLGGKANLEAMEISKSRIRNQSFRKIIESVTGNIGGKVSIKSIPLKDQEGKDLTLSNFSGKLLVVDFWYTGCTNCAVLAKAMRPVISEFRNNPSVVFLSINMDKTREQWVKSLDQGIYSHQESINLSCFPYAFQHPLIKKLNITGAPHLILINEKGDIVDRYPPRPTTGNPKSAANLIRAIKQQLNVVASGYTKGINPQSLHYSFDHQHLYVQDFRWPESRPSCLLLSKHK